MDVLALTARIALLSVFVVSTVGKVRGRGSYSAFVDSLKPFLRAPAPRRTAAAVVTSVEAACVVLLAVPAAAEWGIAISAALLGVFSFAMVWALATGRSATCLCFGSTAQPLGFVHLCRNVVLILCAVIALVTPDASGSSPWRAAVAGVAGLSAAAILIRLDDVVDLFRPAR